MLNIGTAGWDTHSIAHELYSHSQQLLSGAVEDESFFPLVKELPRDADWTDEALWALANPGLGDFRDMQELRTGVRTRQAGAVAAEHVPQSLLQPVGEQRIALDRSHSVG